MALIKQNKTQPTAIDERSIVRDRPQLQAQLHSGDASQRRWAARELLEYRDSAAALVDRLPIESEPSVREAIFTTLARLGDATAVQSLVECLGSDDASLRNEAIEALKTMPSEVAPVMQGLLRHADADVRILAINVLESLRHPRVEQWLIEVIESDPAVNVCGCALDLLTEVGTRHSRAPLQRLKARFASEPYIQFAANLALKRIDPA
jgi:HEAT repeat protein